MASDRCGQPPGARGRAGRSRRSAGRWCVCSSWTGARAASWSSPVPRASWRPSSSKVRDPWFLDLLGVVGIPPLVDIRRCSFHSAGMCVRFCKGRYKLTLRACRRCSIAYWLTGLLHSETTRPPTRGPRRRAAVHGRAPDVHPPPRAHHQHHQPHRRFRAGPAMVDAYPRGGGVGLTQ